MKLDKNLAALATAVADAQRSAPSVSQWSVGMHVHHCCLSMLGISHALIRSVPPPPRSRRPLLPSVLLWIGRLPRGRAQAPRIVIPQEPAEQTELFELVDESRRQLANVAQLNPQAWFKHFEFGVLNRDRALRFMDMHNDHHLRIVSDILSANR